MSEKSKNAGEQMARVRLSDIYHKVCWGGGRKEAEIAMLTAHRGGWRRRRETKKAQCIFHSVFILDC